MINNMLIYSENYLITDDPVAQYFTKHDLLFPSIITVRYVWTES